MGLSFHIVAASSDRWDVRELDAAGPSVSRHRSLEEAKSRALEIAREIGGAQVIVHAGVGPVLLVD